MPGKDPAKRRSRRSGQNLIKLGPPIDPATLQGAEESAPSIAGKTYLFKHNGSEVLWAFLPGALSDPAGWGWRQCGGAVVFESKKCRYIGRFEGDIIRGTALQESGTTWVWSASLAPESEVVPVDCFARL